MVRSYEIEEINEDLSKVFVVCPLCKERKQVGDLWDEEMLESLAEYANGRGYAQDYLWFLDAHNREMLISGTCPDCWKMMFGGMNDD